MKKAIQNSLRKALVLDADMSYALYKYELEEHIDYWKAGMRRDGDEFLFVVTENRGNVAMLLMTPKNELFINEQAREQLRLRWHTKGVYENNMKLFLPLMAEQLAAGEVAVTGVKTVQPPSDPLS
ncbi:hypothetical protein [Hymenobacter elongatus]|uniref:Uncharacterized protein n=1 Tax=Hymenobacter elongatus TaxID=877208 RepID=A0A4Z0PGE7_9BACT|nr:hypothetical protein [Hymenobacter elongatus]TGE14204.1 hypothetical protein E5J99_16945 [Hymenobacter elongatus]